MKQISVQDLSGWLTQADPPMVLDVREPWEVALAKVPGSVAIPMHEIPARLAELPTQQAMKANSSGKNRPMAARAASGSGRKAV